MTNIYDGKYSNSQKSMNYWSNIVYRNIINDYGENLENMEILEVGFGNAELLSKLKDKKASTKGIEISNSAIEKAKEENISCEKIDLSNKNLEKSKILKENSIDIAILLEVLEHTFDFFKLLNEINKALKKGGALYISVPNPHSLKGIFHIFSGKSLTETHNIGHLRFFSKNYLEKVLTVQGFRIEYIRTPIIFSETGKSIFEKIYNKTLCFGGKKIFAKSIKNKNSGILDINYIFDHAKSHPQFTRRTVQVKNPNASYNARPAVI